MTSATGQSTARPGSQPAARSDDAPRRRLSEDGFVRLNVAAVDYDTDESVIVTFDTSNVDPQIDLTFRHGQHLTVRRLFSAEDEPETVEVRRSYSICSPAPDGQLRVAIKRVDGGVFSTFATTELAAGDELDIMPPTGRFTHTLDAVAPRRYSLVAGGSGITPVFSIAATILAQEPESTVDLLYVNRTARQTMLLDELHDLRDRYLDRFRINFVFTREESNGELLSGRPDRQRIDQLIAAGLLPTAVEHVFMCGPIELLDTVAAGLVAAGVDEQAIQHEIFTGTQQGSVRLKPQAVTETSVVVASGTARVHGRTTQFDLYEGDTVLEAVERVRSDAPYSCRAGVCSTCQAVIPDGCTVMDINHGLTNDEVARGYVLTCQARPLPDCTTLEVDFDV